MKLRRYCVTVMDNWTPTREFWTYGGAWRFCRQHQRASLYGWKNDKWVCLRGECLRAPRQDREGA